MSDQPAIPTRGARLIHGCGLSPGVANPHDVRPVVFWAREVVALCGAGTVVPIIVRPTQVGDVGLFFPPLLDLIKCQRNPV